jgi:hypothetical protein
MFKSPLSPHASPTQEHNAKQPFRAKPKTANLGLLNPPTALQAQMVSKLNDHAPAISMPNHSAIGSPSEKQAIQTEQVVLNLKITPEEYEKRRLLSE